MTSHITAIISEAKYPRLLLELERVLVLLYPHFINNLSDSNIPLLMVQVDVQMSLFVAACHLNE